MRLQRRELEMGFAVGAGVHEVIKLHAVTEAELEMGFAVGAGVR
jgi:hypothetical protein